MRTRSLVKEETLLTSGTISLQGSEEVRKTLIARNILRLFLNI
jgi:hypothetical protein